MQTATTKKKLSSDNATALPSGAVVAPLSVLLSDPQHSEKISALVADKLAQVEGSGEVFTALNTAGFTDVMVVWLQADQSVDLPYLY